MNLKERIHTFFATKSLAGQPTEKGKKFLPYTAKSVSRVRQDIQSWNIALNTAQSDEPKNFALQLLFNEIKLDAHLTSQIENRKQQIFSSEFSLKNAKGEVDAEQTALLKKLPAYRSLSHAALDNTYYGYSLVELSLESTVTGEKNLKVELLPRTNVVPQTGLFYPDYSEDKNIPYREMAEFGTWILEFYSGELGLLNKTVSHVLFKRFAQSCWSELCEIYGIPPRVMKTNTQDTVMLTRAERMMEDMGAAAWFIIDETENFEWATGVSTNGDVYKNLIALCTNEISLLISGAVIGQDTINGNRSKDESAQEMLWQLVQSDMAMLEENWNNIIIPALIKIGILKGDVHFEFEPTEDVKQLWNITKEALNFYTIDPDWVKEKFGIEITGERQQQVLTPGNNLSYDNDFFG